MTALVNADVALNYVDERRGTADGPAVIFQHGMGGDLSQPLGLLRDLRVSRLIAPDARGHGASSHLSSTRDANFDVLADDLIRLADHLGLERFVAAGISMGAGASLNLALRYPERIEALILARPAWLDRAMDPWKQEIFAAIAGLLESEDTAAAATLLAAREDYKAFAEQLPATAGSLRGQLTRPQARESTSVLRGFPPQAPSAQAAAWSEITVPTLVIAHNEDPFHPYELGAEYARRIPNATLATITSKERSPAAFAAGFQEAVQALLRSL